MVWLALQYLWYLVAAVALGALVGWLVWGRFARARIDEAQQRSVHMQAALSAHVGTVTVRADAAEREMLELRTSLALVRTAAVTIEQDRTRLLRALDASGHRASQAERALFQAHADMGAPTPVPRDTTADARALISTLKAHWRDASSQRDAADQRVISSQRHVARLDAELVALRRTAGRQLADVHRQLVSERIGASALTSANHQAEVGALQAQVDELWVELAKVSDERRLVSAELEAAQAATERVERLQSELGALRRLHEDERAASEAARAHDQASLADAEQRLADMIVQVQGERVQQADQLSGELEAASARLVSQWHRRLEMAELSHQRELSAAEPRRTWAESKATEASWLARELVQLRTVHESHLCATQAAAARQAASRVGVAQEPVRPPRRVAPEPHSTQPNPRPVASIAPRPIVLQPLTLGRQRRPASDDLQRIEGIEAKIQGALNVAGITSFVRLAAASEDDLRDALASAGLGSDPSLATWGAQAAVLMGGSDEIRPLQRHGAESR